MIGFLDWKSTALVGYEIMIEENTQNIASALRNAILNLGNIPKFVYLDNGRAFRGNTFLTGNEQEKKSLKRKIRKDFHRVKQELGLTNYMLDDLRFSNFV